MDPCPERQPSRPVPTENARPAAGNELASGRIPLIDVGTVALVYPHRGYVVEFVDHEGNTLALLDLAEEEVAPLRGPALLRAKSA